MIPYSKPSPILPPELLQMIAARLTDIVDYVSFRGVCSSWRSAARPADAPKQLPWLLLPYNPAAPARSFYGLSTARTYSFDCCAAVVGRVVCGSSFGWLALIAPDSALSLWNPVTRAVLPLPPPTGLPSYLGPAAPPLRVRVPRARRALLPHRFGLRPPRLPLPGLAVLGPRRPRLCRARRPRPVLRLRLLQDRGHGLDRQGDRSGGGRQLRRVPRR
ncbi:putative basic proline-rich protein-like [Iris pallida]|uniref:Basic proline-rich protein-like n=1 Tax=Iris pallida TaxID=29817 RepID=A0AAX6GNJ8_IRIPA|nr:putative basic proline-rich protein-like [Iris pallida]